MKKTLLSLAVVALSVAFVSCGGSKQVASSVDDEIAALRKEQEKQAILHEMELAKKRQEQELKRLETEAALQEKIKDGNQLLAVFCIDEAVDKEGEYMAGLGIASNHLDEKDAMISANRVALSDITSRFMGVVQNAVSDYSKETNTRGANQIKDSKLEGMAMTVGEKAINKHANIVCRKFVTEKTGTYGCYIALHVNVKEVVESMSNELQAMAKEEEIVDFNAYLFEKKMNEKLRENQEKEAIKQRQQLDNGNF